MNNSPDGFRVLTTNQAIEDLFSELMNTGGGGGGGVANLGNRGSCTLSINNEVMCNHVMHNEVM